MTTDRLEASRSGVQDLLARWRWSSENGVAVLLAAAALATAWSGYQAAVWSAIQSTNFTRSIEAHSLITLASDDVARRRMVDAALFVRWLEAHDEHNTRLTTLYESQFRPALREAFDAWRRNEGGDMWTTTPFERAEYRSATAGAVDEHTRAAERLMRNGETASHVSDNYVFMTVVLANVLFFAGALRPLVVPPLRNPVLGIATLLFIWVVVRLVTSPVAR